MFFIFYRVFYFYRGKQIYLLVGSGGERNFLPVDLIADQLRLGGGHRGNDIRQIKRRWSGANADSACLLAVVVRCRLGEVLGDKPKVTVVVVVDLKVLAGVECRLVCIIHGKTLVVDEEHLEVLVSAVVLLHNGVDAVNRAKLAHDVVNLLIGCPLAHLAVAALVVTKSTLDHENVGRHGWCVVLCWCVGVLCCVELSCVVLC